MLLGFQRPRPQSTPDPAVMGDDEMVDMGAVPGGWQATFSADLSDRTAGQPGQPPNAACGSW